MFFLLIINYIRVLRINIYNLSVIVGNDNNCIWIIVSSKCFSVNFTTQPVHATEEVSLKNLSIFIVIIIIIIISDDRWIQYPTQTIGRNGWNNGSNVHIFFMIL
jgi:hypothetical protein